MQWSRYRPTVLLRFKNMTNNNAPDYSMQT